MENQVYIITVGRDDDYEIKAVRTTFDAALDYVERETGTRTHKSEMEYDGTKRYWFGVGTYWCIEVWNTEG